MSFSVMAGHSPSKDGRSSERPMPGHPRGSACARPKCSADRKPAAWETATPLDDVDGRDKPGHHGAAADVTSPVFSIRLGPRPVRNAIAGRVLRTGRDIATKDTRS